MSKFELYKDHQGGFRWHLKSTEGRTIAVSAEALLQDNGRRAGKYRDGEAGGGRLRYRRPDGDDLLTHAMRWSSALNEQNPSRNLSYCWLRHRCQPISQLRREFVTPTPGLLVTTRGVVRPVGKGRGLCLVVRRC